MMLHIVLSVWLAAMASVAGFCATSRFNSLTNPSVADTSHNGTKKRWNSGIDLDDYHQAWPYGAHDYRYVRYCYQDEQTRQDAKCEVENSLGQWSTALGGKAGKENNHGLEVHEVVDDKKQPIYCYKAGTKEWTDNLAHDTLMIKIDESGYNFASQVGYTENELDNRPGRHVLNLDRRTLTSKLTYVITHEFGHVFGMGHEHSRKDRDKYIKYDCTRVRGYKDGVVKFRAENPGKPDSDLCTDMKFAKKYAGDLTQFIIDAQYEISTDFDFDSVMLYSSGLFEVKDGECLTDITKCPMLKLDKNEKGEVTGTTRITGHVAGMVPSKGDVDFIRTHYKYEEPKALPPGVQPPPPPPPPPGKRAISEDRNRIRVHFVKL